MVYLFVNNISEYGSIFFIFLFSSWILIFIKLVFKWAQKFLYVQVGFLSAQNDKMIPEHEYLCSITVVWQHSTTVTLDRKSQLLYLGHIRVCSDIRKPIIPCDTFLPEDISQLWRTHLKEMSRYRQMHLPWNWAGLTCFFFQCLKSLQLCAWQGTMFSKRPHEISLTDNI